jgi:hypothetical protein
MLPDLEKASWVNSVSVEPEIGAAVRSFVASPRAMEGVYLYIDVGAGTLDGASFRLHRPAEAAAEVNFYCGEVEPLGVAAVAALVARASGRDPAEVEQLLHEKDTRASLGRLLVNHERDINRLVARVILTGKKLDPHGWRQGLDELTAMYRQRYRASAGVNEVPLFIGGGGSGGEFYRSAVLQTYEANDLYSANVRRYSLEELPLPPELDMAGVPDAEFHRFAIAYGLSIPPEEAPRTNLPSSDTDPPPPPTPRGPTGTAYEDTKDLE